jgi:hypothetical protein
MTPEQRLAALLAEAETLKAKAQGPDFTEQDADRAVEISKEIGELRTTIEKKKAATEALNGLGGVAHDSADDAPAASTKTKGLSIGERFVQSDAFQAFKAAHPKPVGKDTPISIKAEGLGRLRARKVLTTGTTGNAAPERIDDVDDLVFRPERRLLEVITRGTTNSPWFQYRQVIAKTNNAAVVAEATTNSGTGTAGGVKPLSDLTTQTADAKAVTYADGMEVTNQELADDGVIQSLIDSTLRENLEITVEDTLINGDSGTNPDEPDGILHTTGVLQQAFATDAPTSIRKAITKLRTTSGAQIRGVLLNPEDDEAWDLLKDLEGRYLGAGPFGSGPRTAWGYERIESQAIEVGQAIIGDFSTIHLLDYEALAILAFNQHKDYAQRNLTYIRAELRATQLIRNAAKLCVVDLTAG